MVTVQLPFIWNFYSNLENETFPIHPKVPGLTSLHLLLHCLNSQRKHPRRKGLQAAALLIAMLNKCLFLESIKLFNFSFLHPQGYLVLKMIRVIGIFLMDIKIKRIDSG